MNIAILGATSAVGEQVARRYAERGARLFLTGRRAGRLADITADLEIRGAVAVQTAELTLPLEPSGTATLEPLAAFAPDVVLVCTGSLPDQDRAWREPDYARAEFELNGPAIIDLINRLRQVLDPERALTLGVISSVAGDRGRAVNGLYGAAKAALNAYLSALRQHCHGTHWRIVTIKPGMIDTPMTAALPASPLKAAPERVARDIVRALDRGQAVLYTPRYWWLIMAVIRLIPEWLFRRLNF